MRALLLFLSLAIVSCSSTSQVKTSDNKTEVIVKYNNVEIYRKNSNYVGIKKVRQLLKDKKEFVIIFGADWCSACKFTKKALKQANLKIDVYFLNIDEVWVRQIAGDMGVRQIPFMVHIDKEGNTAAEKLGSGQIVTYLAVKF